MIVCPNCKYNNMVGTMFCSECGAQLFARDTLTPQTIITDKLAGSVAEVPLSSAIPMVGGEDAWGTLHLLETGQVVPLSTRNEYTIGRISEGQPIMPDIDLSPYQAYVNGVSRLHAVIKRDNQRVIIMDLGSANGSYVNGKRLTSNMEQVLNHGDIVALGKLKIQVLIRP